MKQVKNILYVIGVFIVLGALILVSTAIVMFGTEAIARGLQIVLKEDLLTHISGGVGTAITGVICAIYVKKKKYTQCIRKSAPFSIKACAYYGALAFCICRVLFDAITTFLFAYAFSMTEEANIVIEKSRMDIFLAVLVAPIFEELLFRMGVYSLLRRRFGEKSSVMLCAIIFAVIHGYALQGFLSCLTAGLLFVLIYVYAGNIWYSIAAHMVCNMASNILNVLEDRGVTFLGIPIQYEVNGFNMVHPILIAIATIFCAVCIIRAKKNIKINTKEG